MKSLIFCFLFLFSLESFGASCRAYTARLKHPNATYVDYTSIKSALKDASSGDIVTIGKDTTEDIDFNNNDGITLSGECSNTVKSIKFKKSSNINIKDLWVTPGMSNKACVEITTNGNQYNENIAFTNVQIKNCLSTGVSIDAKSKNISFTNSRFENNAGYGIVKIVESPAPKPTEVTLTNNVIINNHGLVATGSSKDIGNFAQILDSTDSENQTTANNEGPGVGVITDLVARTGPDQTLSVGAVAKLDGADSYTLLNRTLTYSWAFVTKPSTSTAVLTNASTPRPTFTVDMAGDYTIELTVNDGLKTVKDQVIISTNNARPVAIISSHNKIAIGENVSIDGDESFDPDNTGVSYKWVMIKKPVNSTSVVTDSTSSQAGFVADLSGDYILELQVGDGLSFSKKVRRTLSTLANAPVADAGEAQQSYRNTAINLDGHFSADPDLQTLTYQWTTLYSPAGAIATLTNATQSIASFTGNKNGYYIFNLLVSDGTLKNAKTVVINLENRAPTASINLPQDRVEKGQTVNFSATASDPDGDNLTYQWSFISRPAGSSATILNASTPSASFVADVGGQYNLRLLVTDVFGESTTSSVIIKASTRPVARLSFSASTGFLGDDISFNGTLSSDADGDPITYKWSVTSAPTGSVSDIITTTDTPQLAKISITKLGSYTVTLIVSDGNFDSIPVSATFSGIARVNHLPVLGNISANQAIEIAQTLTINLSATDADSDRVVYLISPSTPLKPNMKFDGQLGRFDFKPTLDQVGSHTMTFLASDGKGNVETTVNINVSAPAPGEPTSFRGRVYDANSTSLGHDIPIVGAVVSMVGSNVHYTTDSNGEFFLENIPEESTVFKINCHDAKKAPDGSMYANFIELMHLTVGARNTENRPFYLPRLAADSVTAVVPNKETVVMNGDLGVQIKFPPNSIVNPDGSPYTDTLSISLVPHELAPVQLPEEFSPGMLITVQPSGVKFTQPIPISYPNLDKLPPGTETNIYQIDDKTGMFGVFAIGRVTADGKRIETISGGLVNGSWGFASPPPSFSFLDFFFPPECDKCSRKKIKSEVDLQTGALYDQVQITSYKSAGVERSFNLIYSSVTAQPSIVFNPTITLPTANSIPEYASTQLFVDGAKVTDDIFMDIRDIPKVAGEKLQLKIVFDATHLPTGIYKHDVLASAHFPSTVLRYRESDNPNFRGDFSVVNYKESPYGAGWTLDVLQKLYVQENGNVLLVENGGTSRIFRLKTGGGFEIPSNVYLKLEKNAAAGFKITDKNKKVRNFNEDGLLISEADRNGNETTYFYYPNSERIQFIEDPTGKRFSFFYNSSNMLEKIIDPANRLTLINHDTSGNLTKITKPDLSFREMNFNESHLMIGKTDSAALQKRKKTNEIYDTRTFYVFKKQCESDLTAKYENYLQSAVRIRSIPALVTSGLNSEKLYEPASSVSYAMGVIPQLPLDLSVCVTPDKNHPLPLIQPAKDSVKLADKNGNFSKYDLDERGLIVRTFDPLNRLTQTLRDDKGNVIYEEDAENRIKQTSYDQKNNPTQISIGLGADSVKIKMTYDEIFSQPLIIEEVGNGKTLFTLDAKGNVVASKDSSGIRTYFSYNSHGQVTATTDSSKNQMKLRYDSVGDIKETEDAQGNTTKFFYDLAGNITKIVDAKNQESLFEYSNMNRLNKVTNSNGEISKFEYDYRGNLTAVTDSKNQKTSFTYDSEDNMVQRIDPLGGSELFEYDFEGNLLSHTDKKSQDFVYQYNIANELIKKILPGNKETLLSYDKVGNLKTLQDDFSKLTYSYDDLNRVKTVSTVGAPYQPGVILTNTYTKSNRTKLSSSFGEVNWSYDLQNRIKQLTTFNGSQVGFNYDTNGRRSSVIYPNGITTKLAYDESSRLEKIAHQKNGLDVVSFSYNHDSNGNRIQMKVTSPVAEALAQVNYTYDSVNQLLSATKNVSSNSDEIFSYDNLGNRLKKNNQITNNVFDNNNRVVEDDKFRYAHDDNGNMIKKVNKTSGYTYKYLWDFENKLQFVTEHLTENSGVLKTHTYIYDVLGRRIMKDSNGVVRKYIYDNEDILFEFDNLDALQAKYSHGPGIDEPASMIRNSQEYFYHTDGLGSITGLTNAAGTIVQSYSYNSFGETKVYNQAGTEINSSSMIQSPYGYTGREWDPETNQYYYRARYYDVRAGRFLSSDPIGFRGQDANLYRYVKNQPADKIDPSGKVAPVVIGAAVGGIVYGLVNVYVASQDRCATFKSIALAGLKGGIIGAAAGALATIGGLGSQVALNPLEGLWATSESGSIVASLFGDVLGFIGVADTATSAANNSGVCGCNK